MCARRNRKIAAVVRGVAYRGERRAQSLPVNFDVKGHGLPARQVSESRIPEGRFANAPLQARTHATHNRSVKSDSGHQKKVALLTGRFGNRAANVNSFGAP